MALTRVRGTGKVESDSGAIFALTFATPPAIGNAVVVLVTAFSGTPGGFLGCVDNRGNSYTLAIAQPNATFPEVAVYYCPVITGSAAPFTVTVTGAGTKFWVASAVEVGGVGTGLTVDRAIGQVTVAQPTTTGPTAPLTTIADAFLVAVLSINGAEASIVVESVTPAWTEEHEELNFAHAVGEADTRVVPAAAGMTPACTWAVATGRNYAAALVAFAGGASAPPASLASPYGVENIRVGIIGPNPEVP
jgi:hypothetical protein